MGKQSKAKPEDGSTLLAFGMKVFGQIIDLPVQHSFSSPFMRPVTR